MDKNRLEYRPHIKYELPDTEELTQELIQDRKNTPHSRSDSIIYTPDTKDILDVTNEVENTANNVLSDMSEDMKDKTIGNMSFDKYKELEKKRANQENKKLVEDYEEKARDCKNGLKSVEMYPILLSIIKEIETLKEFLKDTVVMSKIGIKKDQDLDEILEGLTKAEDDTRRYLEDLKSDYTNLEKELVKENSFADIKSVSISKIAKINNSLKLLRDLYKKDTKDFMDTNRKDMAREIVKDLSLQQIQEKADKMKKLLYAECSAKRHDSQKTLSKIRNLIDSGSLDKIKEYSMHMFHYKQNVVDDNAFYIEETIHYSSEEDEDALASEPNINWAAEELGELIIDYADSAKNSYKESLSDFDNITNMLSELRKKYLKQVSSREKTRSFISLFEEIEYIVQNSSSKEEVLDKISVL